MSVESTRQTMERYFNAAHAGEGVLASDVVYTVMATGQESVGAEAVEAMLNYLYQQAFEADAELKNLVIGDGRAVAEFDFVGTHTGEFAGVPATGKSVRVPLCVAYDLENDLIKRARVYFEIPAFLAQVGAM